MRHPAEFALFAWQAGWVFALRSARLHVPNPRPLRDGFVAATALVHGMTVVTRNVDDFTPTGVSTLDPWTAR